MDRAIKTGRYILSIKARYIDGYRELQGCPAYLMNDLGLRVHDLRLTYRLMRLQYAVYTVYVP